MTSFAFLMPAFIALTRIWKHSVDDFPAGTANWNYFFEDVFGPLFCAFIALTLQLNSRSATYRLRTEVESLHEAFVGSKPLKTKVLTALYDAFGGSMLLKFLKFLGVCRVFPYPKRTEQIV